MQGIVFGVLGIVLILGIASVVLFLMYQQSLREAKNYERGLKMVPMWIHLPPASEDIDGGSRDQRELTEELLSQAQVMYSVIASTAKKGFSARIYGQRHISFEIVARGGLVYYYAVVPIVLVDTVKQAIAAAYPSARLQEVEEHNIFSEVGKLSGTIGGEFTLKKSHVYPIATYEETKRDASRALLNALSSASKDDGIGIQLLIRPAQTGWTKASNSRVETIKKERASGKTAGHHNIVNGGKGLLTALWKPPAEQEQEKSEEKQIDKQLTAVEQKEIEAIEEKIRYPGYEVLVRVVVSSNVSSRSQALMNNIVSAFALFDSPSNNGFKFTLSRNIEELTTAYIFRFFPQTIRSNILNSVELSTIFHLPDQSNIPTSQVKRQMSKQVDGPTDVMEEGLLIGYNEFRGVKKPIRLGVADRRRHIHIIGQTGVGKSVLQENLAYQDMLDGRGLAFVDPHGDSVERLLSIVPKERVEDIIYFNPSDMDNPIGLNMFEFDHPDQKDFLVQEAISMLYGLYDPGHTGIVGPRLEHIFRNCALLLMSDPQGGTFIDIPKVLIDQDFMKSKLKYVTDQQVLDFWTKEFPASQRSNEAGEVISWVVSKFGPFISNDAMRNIIGQTRSGFNFPDIMDNKKILLANLSKGKMGDLNSKLVGIVFVMKFQAAAMARAKIPEEERKDFTLYVDEFQNFATDSFETILSEARKYRLSLVLGNQFMTQLREELREAIIGNVGTTITGRIGITDAEIMVKRYTPVFDAEDLTKLPNHESVTVAQIKGVPSAPFSMSWVAPMGEDNPKLRDALKRLSSAKYGRPRAVVEKEIFDRMGSAEKEKKEKLEKLKAANNIRAAAPSVAPKSSGSSFLDEWLAKRQQLNSKTNTQQGASIKTPQVKPSSTLISQDIGEPTPRISPVPPPTPSVAGIDPIQGQPLVPASHPADKSDKNNQDELHINKPKEGGVDDTVHVKLR
ncbi:TraM recognition domain-containing protein [Candidatus Saccharibacteria bacterium]|jgi:hypothetical protein|nr:TraM recognition domain-containing protein [Candidatus Saccharibacteria bacterium]